MSSGWGERATRGLDMCRTLCLLSDQKSDPLAGKVSNVRGAGRRLAPERFRNSGTRRSAEQFQNVRRVGQPWRHKHKQTIVVVRQALHAMNVSASTRSWRLRMCHTQLTPAQHIHLQRWYCHRHGPLLRRRHRRRLGQQGCVIDAPPSAAACEGIRPLPRLPD